MMLLGDLIARFDDEAVAVEALVLLDDLPLTIRIREAAAHEGLTAGEFASAAVQQFSSSASDEEWVTVIGQMGQSNEPGLVLLRRSLIWALAPKPPVQASTRPPEQVWNDRFDE